MNKFHVKLSDSEEIPVIEGNVDNSSVSVLIKKKSLSVVGGIDNIRVYDHYTPNSILPVIAQPLIDTRDENSSKDPTFKFFSFQFDNNPSFTSADIYFKLRLGGSDIVINKDWILRLVSLIKAPFVNPEKLEIEKKLGKQLSSIKNLSVMQVNNLVQTRKIIELDIIACAPRIIIPEDPTDIEGPILIVDLGDLAMKTVNKNLSKEDVKRAEEELASGSKESQKWQEHLYEQYRLDATSLQLLLIDGRQWPLAPFIEYPTNIQLLEKFDVSLSLDLLMCPPSESIAKIRLSGYAPKLSFYLSGLQIRDLLRIALALAQDEGPGDPLPEIVVVSQVEIDAEPELTIEQMFTPSGITDAVPNELSKRFESMVNNSNNENIKIIECHFSIGGGTLMLRREVRNNLLTPMVQLQIKGLVVQYMFRSFDQVAYIGVHAIAIEDLMQTDGPEFKYLANSIHQSTGDLIQIAYEKLKKKSPRYAQLDNKVDLSFNEVAFTFNRHTVLALNELITLAFLSDAERKKQKKLARLKKYNALDETQALKIDEITQPKSDSENVDNNEPKAKLQPPNTVLVQVTVTLKGASMSLNRNGETFSVARLSQSAVSVLYHESILDVKGNLGGICLEDLSMDANFYPEILSISGKHTVDFTFRQYNPTFADYPGYKQKLRLQVNSVNFILLQRYFFEVASYFTEMAEMTKILTSTASLAVAATRKAAQTLSNAEKLEQMFKFEIMMINLKLQIPKNSLSSDFVQLDMGKISLSNDHFIISPEHNIPGERMSFLMSDAHCDLGNALEPGKFTQIIDNIDFLLEWERSLQDEEHLVPGFRLIGEVPMIRFKMTEKQYALWMNTIRQSITERSLRSERSNILNQMKKPPINEVASPNQAMANLANKEEKKLKQKSQSQPKLQHVWVTVAVTINIHRGSVEIVKENESGDVEPQVVGELDEFSFVWISTSDGKGQMHFSFDNIEVYDSRPKSVNYFSKLWSHERKSGEPVFHFWYASNGKGKSRMAFKFDKPVMVMLPIVYTIKNFFTNPYLCSDLSPKLLAINNDGLPEDQKLPRPPQPPQSEKKRNETSVTTDLQLREGFGIENLFHSAEEPNMSMTFIMNDIVAKLPAQPNKETSSGIVLRADFMLKLHNLTNASGLKMFVDNLQVNSCRLTDDSTMIKIIKPINVSYSYFNSPKECTMAVNIDPIYVTFSYRDFRTLMAIGECLKPPAPEPVDEELLEEKAQPAVNNSSGTVATVQQQSLQFFSGGLKVSLIDDLTGSNIPLINFKLYSLVGKLDNWSSSLDSFIQCQCLADFYNREQSNWEPLIEPWSVGAKYTKLLLPITSMTTAIPRSASSYALSEEAKNQQLQSPKYSSHITVQSDTELNINITKIFYETLQNSIISWTKDYHDENSEYFNYATDSNTTIIRNQCGVKLDFFIGNKHDEIVTLRDGEEKILSFSTSSNTANPDREIQMAEIYANFVNIRLHGGWDLIEQLPINRIGSWALSLKPSAENTNSRILWTVTDKNINERLITVQSNIILFNSSNINLQVKLNILYRDEIELPILVANESASIPIQYASSGRILIRPANIPDCSWSTKHINLHDQNLSANFKVLECPTNTRDLSYFFSTKVEGTLGSRIKITFSPPLVFENLLAVPLHLRVFQLSKNEPISYHKLLRGEVLQFHHVSNRKQAGISINIDSFKDEIRRGSLESSGTLEFKLNDEVDRELFIYVDNHKNEAGTNVSSIFAKYWIINKTGLPVLYMQKTLVSSNQMAAGQSKIEQLSIKPLAKDPALWYDDALTNELAQPLMYSYNSNDIFGNKTSIKIAHSKWSKPVSLESVGTDGYVSVPCNENENPQISFQLGVTIELLTGRFHRTKAITFQPRFILMNKMDKNLYYRQVKSSEAYLLPPDKSVPFHWIRKDLPCEICITYSADHTWSSSFPIDNIGEFFSKFKIKSGVGATYLIRVEIQLHQATFFIVFKPQPEDVPPYRIDNQTTFPLNIYQTNHYQLSQVVEPGQTIAYAWDVQSEQHKLTVELLQNKKSYNLDKIKKCSSFDFLHKEKRYFIYPDIFAEGPTRILRFMDEARFNESTQNLSLANGENSLQLSEVGTLKFTGNFLGYGISFIDSKPQELLYISAKSIQVSYEIFRADTELLIYVETFQVDNQLANAQYPVLLAQASEKTEENKYFFSFRVKQLNHYTSINYFDGFSFDIKEMDLHIDDAILNHILAFFNYKLNTSNDPKFEKVSENIGGPGEVAKKIYFKYLYICPIKCNVTFNLSSFGSESEESDESSNPVKTILSAIGVTVATVEDAPISLRSLILENSFHTRSEMMSRITRHYYFQLLYEMYKIVGSFDIIGNPVSLVHNLGTGVYDFFYEPAKGLGKISPKEFFLGLGKGSSSLVKNSVVGIFGTASKITGTLGKGAAQLTFDKDFVRSREKHVREKPKHLGDGMVLGAKEFGYGIFHGLTGVVKSPMQGAKKSGGQGFVKGMGKGVIGAFVKPGVGLFDMATRTTQGIKNTATLHDHVVGRVRIPRGFGPDRLLRVYDVEKAVGQSLLRFIDAGSFADEWHMFHSITQEQDVIIVSNKQVLYIKAVGSELECIWRCYLSCMFFYIYSFSIDLA